MSQWAHFSGPRGERMVALLESPIFAMPSVGSRVLEVITLGKVREDRISAFRGLTNEQIREAWASKLPGVEPTDRDLSAFALGVEIGLAWSAG